MSDVEEDHEATKEWLEVILQGHHNELTPGHEHNLQLKKWSVTPAHSEQDSYLSELLSISVRYEVDGLLEEKEMMAKLLPQDPQSRSFVIETQFDLREIKFYTEMQPALESVFTSHPDIQLSKWSPQCYYSRHRMASESILVLEDLRKIGFAVQDLNQGLTEAQVEGALHTLAQVHAASLALQQQEKTPLGKRFPYLLSVNQAVGSFTNLVLRGLPLLLKFLESKGAVELTPMSDRLQLYAADGGHRVAETFRNALSPSSALNTLIHCDFWCHNLLFRGSEGECRVIDWQMVMCGRPAVDVALLLSTSIPARLRRDKSSKFLHTYWTAFTTCATQLGVQWEQLKYSRTDFDIDYNTGQAMAGLVVVGSADIALGIAEREHRVLELLKDFTSEGIL